MKNNQNTQIAIIGSSSLHTVSADALQKIIAALAFFPDGGTVCIRQPTTSTIEGFVWKLSSTQEVNWNIGTHRAKAGQSNFDRDREMVSNLDQLLAFFPEDKFMEGGTGHVVQCAIEADVPVEAWVQHPDGTLTLVAEHDGNWTGAGRQWQSGRNVADMVLKFQMATMPSLTAVPLKQYPKSSAKPTTSGSTNTRSTGKARSHTGSIFQVRSASAAPLHSRQSSSDT